MTQTMSPESPLQIPPMWWFLCLVYEAAIHFTLPGYRYLDWPLATIGILPLVYGAVITIWADQIFKRGKTAIKPFERPSTLVFEGPFKTSRNPMYVGMTAILIGVALLLGTISPLVGPVVFWMIMQFYIIPIEERNMERTFGTEYAAYKEKVRRWV